MTTPIQTMEWLAAQFRDRAKDDPEPHTEADAAQVEAAAKCFRDMVSALKELDERGFVPSAWEKAMRAVAKAEGRA